MSVSMDKVTAVAAHIHVGHNVPGYLPESDVMCFDSVEDALKALRHEIKDQQEYYLGMCEDNMPEGCECAWCDVAGDCEAALSAIADGDAAWIFKNDRDVTYRFEPQEGPDMRYWLTEIHHCDRDACEIYAEQEG